MYHSLVIMSNARTKSVLHRSEEIPARPTRNSRSGETLEKYLSIDLLRRAFLACGYLIIVRQMLRCIPRQRGYKRTATERPMLW